MHDCGLDHPCVCSSAAVPQISIWWVAVHTLQLHRVLMDGPVGHSKYCNVAALEGLHSVYKKSCTGSGCRRIVLQRVVACLGHRR